MRARGGPCVLGDLLSAVTERGGPSAPAADSCVSAEQAIEQQAEHDQRHQHVSPIPLIQKGEQRKSYAGDGCGDEEEQAKLDQAAAAKGKRLVENSSDGAQLRGLALKYVIISYRGGMAYQVQGTTGEHKNRGENHSGAQELAHDFVDALICFLCHLSAHRILTSARGKSSVPPTPQPHR